MNQTTRGRGCSHSRVQSEQSRGKEEEDTYLLAELPLMDDPIRLPACPDRLDRADDVSFGLSPRP